MFHKILETNIIIVVSPVYWANVSGNMKNFFDRYIGYAMKIPSDTDKVHPLSIL